ncbi:MAG: hypothetical protein ACLQD9_00490 [Thermoplasmata archaeon]
MARNRRRPSFWTVALSVTVILALLGASTHGASAETLSQLPVNPALIAAESTYCLALTNDDNTTVNGNYTLMQVALVSNSSTAENNTSSPCLAYHYGTLTEVSNTSTGQIVSVVLTDTVGWNATFNTTYAYYVPIVGTSLNATQEVELVTSASGNVSVYSCSDGTCNSTATSNASAEPNATQVIACEACMGGGGGGGSGGGTRGDSTSTSVTCASDSLTIGGASTTCTATVTGTGTPTGSVAWSQAGSGGASISISSSSCTLSSKSCSVTARGTGQGSVTLYATYSGDEDGSSGTVALSVSSGSCTGTATHSSGLLGWAISFNQCETLVIIGDLVTASVASLIGTLDVLVSTVAVEIVLVAAGIIAAGAVLLEALDLAGGLVGIYLNGYSITICWEIFWDCVTYYYLVGPWYNPVPVWY